MLAMSQGVEELIARLRDDGVTAGQAEAEAIVAEARSKAAAILQEAETKSRSLLIETREEIACERIAARDALELAARDMLLAFRTELTGRFREEAGRLIRENLEQEETIRDLILIAAGRAVAEVTGLNEEAMEILLPRRVLELDAIRHLPELLGDDAMKHLTIGICKQMMQQGVLVREGIRLQLTESGIEIDLGDKALTAALLRHLQPRFRALLEGLMP